MNVEKKSEPSDDYVDSMLEKAQGVFDYPIMNSYATVNDLLLFQPILAHPITYMSTLVRIGYEPLPPKLTTSLFGKTQLQLPGFFTYIRYIAKTDGFFGIYRGLSYSISFTLINRFVSVNVDRYQKAHYFKELDHEDAKYLNMKNLSLSITCDVITKCVSLTVAYPLHLMMVRSMAQFIGRENYYNHIWGSTIDIFVTGGFSGFYSGYAPFVFGECLYICLESSLVYFLMKRFEKTEHSMKMSFIKTFVSFIVRSITYPFVLVSTVMGCNGPSARSLAASAYTAPAYRHWVDCMRSLWNSGDIKRGSSFMWRTQSINSTYMFSIRPLPHSRKEL